jgi:hypothetical protein
MCWLTNGLSNQRFLFLVQPPYEKMAQEKFTSPCCGFKTLLEKASGTFPLKKNRE